VLRILHTSDWHLGHTLRGEVSREYEHAAFLAWLIATIAREAPEVVLVTGDVFDSGTPPASAERMWFEFLAAARLARPGIEIVAIAGNHDSPARLGAASPVLRELGIVVVGGLPRVEGGAIDVDRVIVSVAGGRALIAAVPFLRAIDLGEGGDLASVYREVIEAARARRAGPGVSLVVTGHLYVAGADAKYLSERRVSIGGVEAAPPGLFPDDVDYVALGHMHRAQRVGRETMRYAGAPIALSLDEGHYKHQVVIVEIGDDGRVFEVRPLMIPRVVEILRIGPAPLGEVVAEIAALPAAGDDYDPARPLLEVIVQLRNPEPRLRATIEMALDGKRARLVRLVDLPTGDGKALADHVGVVPRLAEIDPRDVFVRCWARRHVEPPSELVLAAFDRLLGEVSAIAGSIGKPGGEA
jgi:exonuclease SbcD